MTITNKGFFSLCISLFALIILFNGCEDPGSVGSEFVDRPTLTFDTLTIAQTEVQGYQGYSGRLGFIPIGQYSDPIFGDIETKGFIKPTRTPPLPDSVELDESFQLKMRLRLDSLENYGDTLSQSGFSVYEITSDWRGNALRIDDEIAYGSMLADFTIGQEKEVIIDLPQEWVDEYKCYYYNCNDISDIDSVYLREFKGLAIVSNQQNSKISFTRAAGSGLIMINGVESDTTDTVNVALRDWGFTLNRSGASIAPNTFPLHTTLEGMNSITMPDSLLKAENKTKNIIRADLVFYEAEDVLNENLPANHVRLGVTSLNLDVIEPLEPAYEYQFGQVDFSAPAEENEPVFKINVTRYVNNVIFGDETREKLILGVGSSSGALRSTLIYDVTAPEDLRPKLILTSLVD